MTGLVVIAAVWLLLAWVSAEMAERRGRSWRWMLVTVFLSPIVAIICLALLGDTKQADYDRQSAAKDGRRGVASPAQIRELADLRDQGLVTAEEYEEKRADILRRI